MTLRREAAVHIPSDVDPVKYAPLLCAGITVFNGIRQMSVRAGELVAIQGIGGLGHLAIQYAAKLGYRVAVLSRGREKEEFALRLGAEKYIDTSDIDGTGELVAMGGAALIVTTAPSKEAISPLTKGLQPGGKLLLLGAAGSVPFDTISMLFSALSIHGWPSGSSIDCEEAVQFAKHHDIDCMVTSYPLLEANKALADATAGKTRFRAVLKM